jgi:hypothetical protein
MACGRAQATAALRTHTRWRTTPWQVPWVGFPLYKLLDKVKPLASARYVEFQTFYDESVSDNQRLYANSYPYPYIEVSSPSHGPSWLRFSAKYPLFSKSWEKVTSPKEL